MHASLEYELSSTGDVEVACEQIKKGKTSQIKHARVGLLIPNLAFVKKFNGDCWSVSKDEGQLDKTRNPRNSGGGHTEVWAKQQYAAIVIKGGHLSKKIMKTLEFWSEKTGLPILKLKGDKLS